MSRLLADPQDVYLRRIPVIAGVLTGASGACTLIGWATDSDRLRSLLPGLVAMNPVTALCFMAAGTALAWGALRPRAREGAGPARVLAVAVLCIAGARLLGLIPTLDLGIDQWLFSARLDHAPALPPNRMAPNTALSFVLLASALILGPVRTRSGWRPAQVVVLGVLLLSLFALIGYAYGSQSFYAVKDFIPMALNTALTFTVIAAGVFLRDADGGLAAVLLAPDSGGLLVRRVLPAGVLALGVLGWAQLAGRRAGWYDPGFGVSLQVAGSGLVLTVAVWIVALRLRRTEEARRLASEALREAHDDLERRVEARTRQLLTVDRRLAVEIASRSEAEASLVKVTRAVEQTADLIMLTDREGRIEYVNPAFERQTGWTREELIGRDPSLLRSDAHPPEFHRELWETVQAGGVFRGVFVNRKRSGEQYHEEKTVSPIRDADGAITHFVSTGVDVTERVRLEQQLLQSQKLEAIGRLAGGISHDFNNLLTAIIGFGGMALEDLDPGDPLHAKLQQIVRAGDRAAVLTRQLLAFSRQQVLQPRVVDLNQVVIEIDKLLRRLIGADVDLRTVLDTDLGHVNADPGQLGQVLMNLAVNARDAMPNGGRLTIESSNLHVDSPRIGDRCELPPGDYVVLSVTDSGTGIDPAVMPHIFDPFYTTKDLGKGTGLGLATVHGIVTQSGGHLEVYSEPGRGACFKVYLPRVDAAVDQEPARDAGGPRATGSGVVLLVEDEDLVRALVSEVLEQAGYQVIATANGDDAMRQIAELPRLDLLVTDVVLPGVGGPELCEHVRSTRPGTRVLLISGYTDRALEHRGSLLAETPFLQKPFTRPDLLTKVRQVLGAAEERAA